MQRPSLILAFCGMRVWGALHHVADSWPEIAVTRSWRRGQTRQQATTDAWVVSSFRGSDLGASLANLWV